MQSTERLSDELGFLIERPDHLPEILDTYGRDAGEAELGAAAWAHGCNDLAFMYGASE